MFDLSIIKVGHEYATFQDYRIRDAINELIKNLEADMDEVGFDASPKTKQCIDEFEKLITDIETVRNPKPPRIELKEDEEDVREVIGEVDVHPIKNIDDELDEFESTLKK